MDDALGYVAKMMNISRTKASELTGLANDAVEEVLDLEHIEDHSPEREFELEQEEAQVNVEAIARNLHALASEFHVWTEDGMVFIEYGENLSEGIAAEGPTCLSATANFYCRWYNDIIIKGGDVLLSDDKHHQYDEKGEE